jgi:SsrA-binding protein
MAKGKKRKKAPGDVATNRQASFRYHLSDNLEAGMVLTGTEVKSLRGGKAQIKDGYVALTDGELWLHNVHIPPYQNSRDNHEPERVRKLLAKRSEIDRLRIKVAERGFTIVPLRIYFSDSKAKIEIALGRGKDQSDKRRTIKERELKRDMDRALAER